MTKPIELKTGRTGNLVWMLRNKDEKFLENMFLTKKSAMEYKGDGLKGYAPVKVLVYIYEP